MNRQLTDRQAEVHSLMAKGYHNKRIALELGITAQTVKNHITAIFLKLGVQNRTEAAIKLLTNKVS